MRKLTFSLWRCFIVCEGHCRGGMERARINYLFCVEVFGGGVMNRQAEKCTVWGSGLVFACRAFWVCFIIISFSHIQLWALLVFLSLSENSQLDLGLSNEYVLTWIIASSRDFLYLLRVKWHFFQTCQWNKYFLPVNLCLSLSINLIIIIIIKIYILLYLYIKYNINTLLKSLCFCSA